MRLPVSVNRALQTAGSTGGNAGSPSPVGELSVFRKCTSISGGDCVKRTGGVFVEVALDRAAAINCDLVAHQVAEPFDHRTLHFVERAAGIDDLAADVASNPHFANTDFVAGREVDFRDFRKVPAVAEMESHAHGGVFRKLAGAPARFFGDEFEHPAHTLRIEQ